MEREQYLKESKKRLNTIIDRKMQTTFIGALSAFQNKFGFLWGDESYNYTEETEKLLEELKKIGLGEDYCYQIWMECREKVLNNGNNQMRAINNELEQYTIEWNRYRLNLPVKPRKSGGNNG